MISDWITSFSMWQTLIAASTATTVPSLPREGAAAALLPPRRLGVLASIAMSCAVGVPGGRIGTKATRTASIHLPRDATPHRFALIAAKAAGSAATRRFRGADAG